MSGRFLQLQTEAAYGSRARPSTASSRPQPSPNYSRSSTSSETSSSSSGSYQDEPLRHSMDTSAYPRVAVLRCSRCAKSVETISTGAAGNELRRVHTDDARASGMVRFGHNLYYCDRCAKMVGYN